MWKKLTVSDFVLVNGDDHHACFSYLENSMDGFYIAPAFMDKLVVHITKNFMSLPNIKVFYNL